MIKLWNELTGKAGLERELAGYRAAIQRARVGERPKPTDMLLYILHQCPRENGLIVITPPVQDIIRKTLSGTDFERAREGLRSLPDQLDQLSDRARDLLLPVMSGQIRILSHRLRHYINEETL